MDKTESVDFDFFDTPRVDDSLSPQSKKTIDKKTVSPTSAYRQKKDGDLSRNGDKKKAKVNSKKEEKYKSSDNDLSSSESDSITPRYKTKQYDRNNRNNRASSPSESSSAYSNSDYSSDEDEQERKSSVKKEKLNVHMPRANIVAWSEEHPGKEREKQNKHSYESSDSDIDLEHEPVNTSDSNHRKSKISQNRKKRGNGKKKLIRSSSSFSNNSDITDVSPLESPEGSPRYSHKRDTKDKGNKSVQYSDKNVDHSINLESDEIDLSILMKCMADIDKEKQERLKANSRRVMFAQPTTGGSKNSKGNYTFSMGQAKLIEKENQRLLKKIMNQMSGPVKKAPGTIPRQREQKRRGEPIVQRLTPSAVNRMREQRRIEEQNMVSMLCCFITQRC
jgi:hypothetical protein